MKIITNYDRMLIELHFLIDGKYFMKRKNKKITTLLILLLLSAILLMGCLIFLMITDAKIISIFTSAEQETEIIMETESETEIDSQIEPVISKPLSYVEKCELDYVEPPVKRTREEAVEKIKELSRWFPALYFVYTNEEQYPLELLLSGAGNPEMTDFLYGYLTSDGSTNGNFTDEEQPEDFPLLLQWDIRWGYMPYGTNGTVGSSGCGPTCLSMAVFYLTGNRECTPDVIAQYSLDEGHYVEGVGTAWALLDNYPTEFGLTVTHPALSDENLKAHLDKGNILICSVRPGEFTSEGHFIVIYGYDENGYKINDPKCVYRSRLSWTYEQIQDDIKRVWSVGK